MVNAGRATQQRGTRSATGQDWDESGDWGGTGGAPVPSQFSRLLPLLNLSSSCPSFLGGQLAAETWALFRLQKQQLLHTGFTHPREFNDTLQNSQFSLLRLLLLTHPHTTLRIQTRAAALPPLIAFLGQSCRSRNNKTEAKGLSSTREDGGKVFWKILMK